MSKHADGYAYAKRQVGAGRSREEIENEALYAIDSGNFERGILDFLRETGAPDGNDQPAQADGKLIFTNDKMEPVLTVDQRTGKYEIERAQTHEEAIAVVLDINERQAKQIDAVRSIVELLETELGVLAADGLHAQPEGDLARRLNRCIVRLAVKGGAA